MKNTSRNAAKSNAFQVLLGCQCKTSRVRRSQGFPVGVRQSSFYDRSYSVQYVAAWQIVGLCELGPARFFGMALG